MLARRLPGILPDLDDAAAVQAASLRSLAGLPVTRLDRIAPFEAPHHSASVASLIGGGSRTVRPGAIARASGGVLFLDEAGEYGAHALDALRQPLESGSIEIHRAGFRAVFPARFQLVAHCVRLVSVHLTEWESRSVIALREANDGRSCRQPTDSVIKGV